MPTFTVYKGSADGSIIKSSTTRPDLTGTQVLVRITASGVCGTDEHYRHTDMTLGHEGAGVVEALGPSVKHLKRGDRVGWGYEHDNCGMCTMCLTSRDHFCPSRAFYGLANLDQGSFASHAIWNEAWLFRIPASISDAEAAPLMCGGATVFNALRFYGVKATDRVGVVGVGGLGHLAIQFASKMGCEVVVFSGSGAKREEAVGLGAREFVVLGGNSVGEVQGVLGRKLDVLMVTMSRQPDWSIMLPLMAPDSIIFPISISQDDLKMPYDYLLQWGIRIQGTVVAPRAIHRQMLEFAALHQVKPMINEFPLTQQGITDAMRTLRDGKMRYRAVLIPEE